MATGLALLEEPVQSFAGVDVEGLSGDELHETIRRLSAVANRLEAQVVRVVHRWDATLAWADNGSKAPGPRLARETGMPKGDAQHLVRRGRALQSMPLTEAAYAAGELNGAHVDLIASCDRAWVNATSPSTRPSSSGSVARTCTPSRSRTCGCGRSSLIVT